jgi:hypothetical protein
MKTVIIFYCTLLIIPLISSCFDYPEWETEPDYSIEYKTLDFFAEVSEVEGPFTITEGRPIGLYGKAINSYGSEQVSYSITGIITNLESSNEYEILDGDIELISEKRGNKLIGRFSGKGYKTDYDFSINAIISVDIWTGSFKADGGNLTLIIVGTLPKDDNHKMNYKLSISGYLERKVNKTK